MTIHAMAFAAAALVAVTLGMNTMALRSLKGPEHQEHGTGSAPADSLNPRNQQPHEYVLKPWRSLRGHLHNKLIHVPIGFALSGFLLSLIALRWDEVEPAVRWLVLVAAIGSVLAYLTGTSQAALLEGGSKDWVIQLHQKLGIATGIVLWVWTAVCWTRRFRKWSVIVGGVVVALVTVTGFFGGVIAHG